MTRILFLDIDGVLNSHRTAVGLGGIPSAMDANKPGRLQLLDQAAVGLLRALCAAGGVQIVLSSTWRMSPDWKCLADNLRLPIIDRTPRLLGPRGAEIAHWLAEHPEVERYAIVDDDSDMLPEQLPNFVHVKGDNGFLWDHHVALCTHFGCNPHGGRVNRLQVLSVETPLTWPA